MELTYIFFVLFLTVDSGFSEVATLRNKFLSKETCLSRAEAYKSNTFDSEGDLILISAFIPAMPSPEKPLPSL